MKISVIRRFKVQSCANRTFRVTAVWKKKYARPGVITRMAVARLMEEWLNKAVTK